MTARDPAPSPLLEKLPPESLEEDIREAHERSMALRGDATFFEVFGQHPDLYRWYTESFYGDVFAGGLVPRRIKELIRLRLSTEHGCRFCNQGNRADALAAGLSEQTIDQLADYENGEFNDAEKAALRLADEMLLTNADSRLRQSLYDDLARHFSDAQILEMGLVLGVLAGMAKFLFAFDLVEKESSCPIGPG